MNTIDNTRLDLVIPGQQHMYLRAPSPQDRQKWLVALGSAKACVDSKGDAIGRYSIKLVFILNLFLVLMYFDMHLRHKSVYCMPSKVVPVHTTVEYETLLLILEFTLVTFTVQLNKLTSKCYK